MTYVSRKTRLLTPRWLEEADAGYSHQLYRKRSDGRLKRFPSCEDPRAWSDNECLNHEHLVEYMSAGEFLGSPPFHLYGRYIPVPVLIDLLNGDGTNQLDGLRETGRITSASKQRDTGGQCWKLLSKAIAKLELVNSVVNPEHSYNDAEDNTSAIANSLAGISCFCNMAEESSPKVKAERKLGSGKVKSQDHDEPKSDNDQLKSPGSSIQVFSESGEKLTATSPQYKQLVAEISKLRNQLNEIEDHRIYLLEEIKSCQRKIYDNSVTELYNREEEVRVKELQNELDKVNRDKELLLSLMIEVVNKINKLKETPEIIRLETEVVNNKEVDGEIVNETFKIEVIDDEGARLPDEETASTENFTGSPGFDFREDPRTFHQKDRNDQLELSNKESLEANTLEVYEDRLNAFGHLEEQVEELQKKATMADYYKERWLRCCLKGDQKCSCKNAWSSYFRKVEESNSDTADAVLLERNQLKTDLSDMYEENNKLKFEIDKLISEAKMREEQNLYLLEQEEDDVVDLENKLKSVQHELLESQEKCRIQEKCIDSLEETVNSHRDEIKRLMALIQEYTKWTQVTEAVSETSWPDRGSSHSKSRSKSPTKLRKKFISVKAKRASSILAQSSEEDFSCYCPLAEKTFTEYQKFSRESFGRQPYQR